HFDGGQQQENTARDFERAEGHAKDAEDQRARDCEGAEDEERRDRRALRHVAALLGRVALGDGDEDRDDAHRIDDEEDRREAEDAEGEPFADHRAGLNAVRGEGFLMASIRYASTSIAAMTRDSARMP